MNLTKYVFFILLFTSCRNEQNTFVKKQIIHTKIDSLNSIENVEKFVRGLEYPIFKIRDFNDSIIFRKPLAKFELKRIIEFDRDSRFDIDSITKRIADSLNITKSFYKADFDNNGFTDLVIIGDDKGCSGGSLKPNSTRSCDYSVYTLMNFGNDSINPNDIIIRAKHNSIVPKVIATNKGTFLEIHESGKYRWMEKQKLSENKKYVLTYMFDDFIEYNDNVKNYSIEKIEYSELGCEGECPVYDLMIDSNRIGKLVAKEFNSNNPELIEMEISNEMKGAFKSTISETKYNEIISLFNYLDFPKLNAQYSLERLHTQDCVLKITYNNGKVKTIYDSGMCGSYGLKRVYGLLSELRYNQEWK